MPLLIGAFDIQCLELTDNIHHRDYIIHQECAATIVSGIDIIIFIAEIHDCRTYTAHELFSQFVTGHWRKVNVGNTSEA
ncbi:hypothetical protein D3C87_2002250 [compost metagenome]